MQMAEIRTLEPRVPEPEHKRNDCGFDNGTGQRMHVSLMAERIDGFEEEKRRRESQVSYC